MKTLHPDTGWQDGDPESEVLATAGEFVWWFTSPNAEEWWNEDALNNGAPNYKGVENDVETCLFHEDLLVTCHKCKKKLAYKEMEGIGEFTVTCPSCMIDIEYEEENQDEDEGLDCIDREI